MFECGVLRGHPRLSRHEALRFREGESKIAIGAKAFAGAIWFLVAYVIRVYVALLIEPYVNPVKQVPMTAAAHKMMLPFAPQCAPRTRRI